MGNLVSAIVAAVLTGSVLVCATIVICKSIKHTYKLKPLESGIQPPKAILASSSEVANAMIEEMEDE